MRGNLAGLIPAGLIPGGAKKAALLGLLLLTGLAWTSQPAHAATAY